MRKGTLAEPDLLPEYLMLLSEIVKPHCGITVRALASWTRSDLYALEAYLQQERYRSTLCLLGSMPPAPKVFLPYLAACREHLFSTMNINSNERKSDPMNTNSKAVPTDATGREDRHARRLRCVARDIAHRDEVDEMIKEVQATRYPTTVPDLETRAQFAMEVLNGEHDELLNDPQRLGKAIRGIDAGQVAQLLLQCTLPETVHELDVDELATWDADVLGDVLGWAQAVGSCPRWPSSAPTQRSCRHAGYPEE